ncbi:hypothetical protein ElyMa_002410700 [Elysia marginata]|uniref:Uncharacterized protein n=1 Tax=Elysia marginata TaxID=1093978 RepID=A0AAV4GFD3_9GAST|nr:hypothetical protein ElyMa_002410700 [Elysia marginata]
MEEGRHSLGQIFWDEEDRTIQALGELPRFIATEHFLENHGLLKEQQGALGRLGMEGENVSNQKKRNKLKYFGHVKQHDKLEKQCMEDAIESIEQDIAEWLKMTTTEAARRTFDR